MDPVELGKRIKEARLAKKMTQADVVGDFITRNMLSQIESGTANPSVKTLTYIAKVLALPVNYLLPDELELPEEPASDEAARDERMMSALQSFKNAYMCGDYKKAVEYAKPCSDSGEVYDEACCVLAMSYLELARAEKDTREAVSCAKLAAEYADKGIFKKREVRASALLLLDELAEKL